MFRLLAELFTLLEQQQCKTGRLLRNYGPPTVYSIPFSILLQAFSDIHISEDRQIAGIDKHMAPLLGSAFELWAQEGGVKTDGVIFETCPGGPCSVSAYVAIREVKNEIGTAHTDSYSQASLIYRKLWAHSSREWMNPCL